MSARKRLMLCAECGKEVDADRALFSVMPVGYYHYDCAVVAVEKQTAKQNQESK